MSQENLPEQPDAPAPLPTDLRGIPTIPAAAKEIPLVDVVAERQGMFGATPPGDTSGFDGLVEPALAYPPASRPYGGWFDAAVDELQAALADASVVQPLIGEDADAAQVAEKAIEKVVVDRGELTLFVPREYLRVVAQLLRDEPGLRFELSLGVTGVNYPMDAGRELHSVMHLRSITHNRILRLETTCPDADPHVPSTVDIYPTNDWHEREAYDFFGIIYDGHPSLQRIAMPDDWVGHPQRKDYPLGGIPVEYKGATTPPPDERRQYFS